ncbi:MAG TPA: hypothetical protein VG267_20480 [Terracidiphilus sp.]|jgi:hypothetical protein|nr:hypothetical protein [Terracidiphilus sp.]
MHRLLAALVQHLPTQFRILYRQFLLRVIDLEALSIDADIPRFLGQFAGILIMFSLLFGVGAVMFPPPRALEWHVVESWISSMLLVIGLVSVITWDATFPDRRDVMVLGTLPVRPATILLAKLSASAALLSLAIVCLNCTSSIGWSIVFGAYAGFPGFARFFASYWIAMVAASAFLYGSLLTLQGFTALLLPRRWFLRVSALLQLAAFGTFMAVYFLQPSLDTYAQAADPANHWLLSYSPTFWFFALFQQLNGTLPQPLAWVAHRAWIALAIAIAGAVASLLFCYVHTMKKTVEEADLVPGSRGFHFAPRLGDGLNAAIVLFCLRSLARSLQHRVAVAFFLSLACAIALALVHHNLSAPPREPISTDFLISTFMMMSLVVLGLRAVFALPIALSANWVLRLTQLRPTGKYFNATRLCLLLFGVLPTVLVVAALALHFRPWQDVAAHLLIYVLLGFAFVELALFRFDKVPFTCSYLPGKTNVQVLFWGFTLVWIILGGSFGIAEMSALHDLAKYLTMVFALIAIVVGLGAINRVRARTAVLYFEELPQEPITRLGLLYVPPAEPS